MTNTMQERDEAALRDYLAGFDLFAGNEPEGAEYLRHAFRRFMLTLTMIPPAPSPESRLLELGANPYFLTLLIRRFRGYRLTLANFFGAGHQERGGVHVVSNAAFQERHEFAYDHFNVEIEPFPYETGAFEFVLCCEILEHLTVNPRHCLREIRRVLRPNGRLLLTTPNVLACQNFLKLAIGRNIYDAYSGYGAYGRHNREYAPQEVKRLLAHCGFVVETLRIKDIQPHAKWLVRLLKRLRPAWRDNLFVLARASGEPSPGYPAWLYRSVS